MLVVPYAAALSLVIPLRVLSLGIHLLKVCACCKSFTQGLEWIERNRNVITVASTIIIYAAHASTFVSNKIISYLHDRAAVRSDAEMSY